MVDGRGIEPLYSLSVRSKNAFNDLTGKSLDQSPS
ncbi:hypothetical protein BRC2024_HCTLARHO_CDS_0051 [Acinetobacter phage vB_AbaS_Silvergun]